MTLIQIIIMVAIAGFLVWLVGQVPMPDVFKKVIYAISVVLLLIFVLQALGVPTGLPHMRLFK